MRLNAACALSAWLATAVLGQALQPITREVYLMGTRARLTTWAADREAGLERLERLLRPLERTEALLSTWRADSEVSLLNASAGGGPVRLSPSLCKQFRVLDELVRDTGGAFDPAVGALTAAWDIHGKGRVPSPAQITAARRHSGWARVSFDARGCTIALPANFSIDVGGFGKGEALDRARDTTNADEGPWLIDLGGQVAVRGTPPGTSGWDVAIAHPRDRSSPAVRLRLASGSLATSAGSERDLQVNGRRIGHILDPRTGRTASFTGSVTVWDESGLVADALSTALYVMGAEEGLQWANARGVAACFLSPLRTSRAFAARFEISVP